MEPILDPEHQELERQLMHVGREVRMSPHLRARTLAALAAGAVGVSTAAAAQAGTTGAIGASAAQVGAGAAHAGATAATTQTFGASTLAWLAGKGLATKGMALVGAGLIGGAGLVGAALVGGSQQEDSGGAPVRQGTPTLDEGGTSQLEVAEDPVEAPIGVDSTDGTEAQSPATVRRSSAPRSKSENKRPVSQKGSTTASPPTLGEELSQLGRVESALGAGRPGQALQHLEEYRKRFPRPQLGLEAEVLTIQALHESGSASVARSRAERFVERYPKSPLGVRAKQYLK